MDSRRPTDPGDFPFNLGGSLSCDPYPASCPPGPLPPGVPCYVPASSDHLATSDGASPGELRAVLGTSDPNVPTAFSSSAALAAHLLRQQVHLEQDLGIVPGKVHLWPESVNAFLLRSPFHSSDYGTDVERYVQARPEWSTPENGSSTDREADSSRKYTLVHELTHAMQHLSAGDDGNGIYGYNVIQPDGREMYSADPEGFPVECRCNHIGNQFSPAHCLDSVEVVGAASGEGFAHAMAARAFNDASDLAEDCWFLYAKDVLVPPREDGSCPSGSVDPAHPGCIQVGSPEGQAMVAERYSCPTCDPAVPGEQAILDRLEYDRDRLLTELAGWYFVIAPARIDCAVASKWRNRHCASAVSASLGPNALAAVEYMGTELDWLQFFWGLTRGDDAWTPAQFLALQRAACAQRICSAVEWSPECAPQRCVGSDGITFEAWGLYAELTEARRPETVAVTAEQWNRLRERGNEYGVSTDLQP